MSPEADAALAAALLASDPEGLGGAVVRGGVGRGRTLWLEHLRGCFGEAGLLRAPATVSADRLVGGLDVAATLAAGRPAMRWGLLERSGEGALVLPMAERLDPAAAAVVGITLDTRRVTVERDGFSEARPFRAAVVALDEAEPDEPGVAESLAERLAFHLQIDPRWEPDPDAAGAGAVARARRRLAEDPPVLPDDAVEALCATALRFGVASLRPPLMAVAAARASAALRGAPAVEDEDLELAARLVIGPRAVTLPVPEPEPEEEAQEPRDPEEAEREEPDQDDARAESEPPPPEERPEDADRPRESTEDEPLAERVVEAVRVGLPEGVLRDAGSTRRGRARRGGRGGEVVRGGRRGAPIGSRPGDPREGGRLDVLGTIRAAVPWQSIRPAPRKGARVAFRADDLRVRVYAERPETLTVFAVDASGSQALHRLAEAKGAVELLLADSYVERARVALVTFRGMEAEISLPPTRSLVRARRVLAGVPGGGATPLASGLELAGRIAIAALRDDVPARILILTDGRPNVARDGSTGRGAAEPDTLEAARAIRRLGVTAAVVDTSARGQPFTKRLAEEIGGTHTWLPAARAADVHRALTTATEAQA